MVDINEEVAILVIQQISENLAYTFMSILSKITKKWNQFEEQKISETHRTTYKNLTVPVV
jgi:hypothetical protein